MTNHRLRWALSGLLVGLFLSTAFFVLYRELLPGGVLRRTLDPPIVIKEIQQIKELLSVKYTIQSVVGLEEKKVPLGSEKILLIVQAEVLGGIDLSRLSPKDVRKKTDGALVIALPPPEVLHIIIDDRQTKVWDRSITWWTPWVPYNPDLERQARLASRESIKKSALEMGILDQAQQNAETSIRTLLESAGASSVTFVHGM